MELVENPYVSDFTKKTLEQFGWCSNDPIPADLGQLMLQIKDQLPPSSRTDVLIDKDGMGEEDIEKIKEMLKAAKGAANKIAEQEKLEQTTTGMSGSVRDMYERLVTKNNNAEIIDDREAPETAEKPVPEQTADAVTAPKEPEPPPERILTCWACAVETIAAPASKANARLIFFIWIILPVFLPIFPPYLIRSIWIQESTCSGIESSGIEGRDA